MSCWFQFKNCLHCPHIWQLVRWSRSLFSSSEKRYSTRLYSDKHDQDQNATSSFLRTERKCRFMLSKSTAFLSFGHLATVAVMQLPFELKVRSNRTHWIMSNHVSFQKLLEYLLMIFQSELNSKRMNSITRLFPSISDRCKKTPCFWISDTSISAWWIFACFWKVMHRRGANTSFVRHLDRLAVLISSDSSDEFMIC